MRKQKTRWLNSRYQIIDKNARFWAFINMDWVKITLVPMQTLRCWTVTRIPSIKDDDKKS